MDLNETEISLTLRPFMTSKIHMLNLHWSRKEHFVAHLGQWQTMLDGPYKKKSQIALLINISEHFRFFFH